MISLGIMQIEKNTYHSILINMEEKDLFEKLVEEIDDFDLDQSKVTYEIDIVLNESDSVMIDSGYDDLNEAKRCYEYFDSEDRVNEFLKSINYRLPAVVEHVKVVLLMQIESEEITEILEENEIF